MLCRYGDLQLVDSTFLKNNESYPLTLSVGIDGQYRSCILGQALLFDATEPCFAFYLSAEREILGNRINPPNIIMSDEERAFLSAQESIIPSAIGLRCDWHFSANISDKLGGHSHKSELSNKFYAVRMAPTEESFEQVCLILNCHIMKIIVVF